MMYISKYWGNYIGGSWTALKLVAFLEDQQEEEIPLNEIFAKIGLDKSELGPSVKPVVYLEFNPFGLAVEIGIFILPIDVITDLASHPPGVQCVSGSVKTSTIWTSTTLPPAVSASPPRQRNTAP